MRTLSSYVLITPARNEAQFIELTIQSVIAQNVKPLRWVIVSDGSTDATDAIVQKYAADYPWIELVRMPERRERHFAGKVHAFDAGRARVKDLPYEVIANLDADVEFDAEYFAFLLDKFAENPRLGVAGTPFTEGSFQYDYRFTSIEHVSGQIQVFRRECFEQIGGYVPRKVGGIDHVAVISARMKGWQTRTFLEKTYIHHRRMGTATSNALMVCWNTGKKDYVLGGAPLFEVFRCIYQTTRPPVLIGGALHLAGYLWAMMWLDRQVPAELVAFRKQEQIARLKRLFRALRQFSIPSPG